MKHFQFLFSILVLFTVQIVLAPHMALGRITPDFPLLIVAYFAMTRSPERSAAGGFVVGLLTDFFNPQLLGLNALTKTVIGWGLAKASKKSEPDNMIFMFALFGVAALAHDFLYLLFFTGLHPGRFFVMFFTVSIPSALYTALIGVAIHWLATSLKRKAVRTFGKARS